MDRQAQAECPLMQEILRMASAILTACTIVTSGAGVEEVRMRSSPSSSRQGKCSCIYCAVKWTTGLCSRFSQPGADECDQQVAPRISRFRLEGGSGNFLDARSPIPTRRIKPPGLCLGKQGRSTLESCSGLKCCSGSGGGPGAGAAGDLARWGMGQGRVPLAGAAP